MKRILFGIFAALLLVDGRSTARAEVTVEFFYDTLTPYGSWTEVGNYGYCWQPRVAASNVSWRPYSDGYWAYTDVGWTWISYEDFGWATYHYGRWVRLRDRGWFWVPGHEWGPAWVSWRFGGNYVGWAPLPMRESGGEVVYEGRPVYGEVDVDYDIGPQYYNFIDVRYIGEPLLRERIFEPSQNVVYIERTVNVTNITYNNSQIYNYGPDYNVVSTYSTRPIQRLTVQRETNAQLTSGATQQTNLTQVRGDKLVVSAPQRVARPSASAAPRTVTERIAQPTVERGWSGVDTQTATRIRERIRKEDRKNIPPPDITPHAGASATSAATATPATTPAPSTAPSSTPSRPAAAASPSPAVSASPPVSVAPKGKNQRPGRAPANTPPTTAAPSATATPPPPNEKARGRRGEPHPVPSAAPQSSVGVPAATPAAPTPPSALADHGRRKAGREEHPAAPPNAAAAPSAPAAPDSPKTSKHGERHRPEVAPQPQQAPPDAGADRGGPPQQPPRHERSAPPSVPPAAHEPRPEQPPNPAPAGQSEQHGEKAKKKEKPGETPPSPGQ